ncbi:hypothetical protein VTJ04DRAFT_10690 [Mycothermus thermophilus]|uniref:uncharacterized protein n=1 Tax=Humicola insolens TaxID=85995 RepID=UPI003743F6CC
MAHLPPNAAIFSPSVARAAASAAKDWSYIDAWLQRKFRGNPPPFERNPDTLRALLALASVNEAADEERALLARLESQTLDQLRAREQHGQEDDHDYDQDLNRARRRSSAVSANPADDEKEPKEKEEEDILASARDSILTALEEALPREGQIALTALASLSLQMGQPLPTASSLGAELVSLSAQSLALEQSILRVEALAAYIEREAAATARLAAELRPPSPSAHHDSDSDNDSDHHHNPPATPLKQTPHKQTPRATTGAGTKTPTGFHPPTDLPLQNLSLQKQIKSLTARLPELRDRAASLARSFVTSTSTTSSPTRTGSTSPTKPYYHSRTTSTSTSPTKQPFIPPTAGPSPTIQQVRALEEEYLALLAQKRKLDADIREFAGLPPDVDAARRSVEGVRRELEGLRGRRDGVWEGLVEAGGGMQRGRKGGRR